MTRSGTEPRSFRPLANTLTIIPMGRIIGLQNFIVSSNYSNLITIILFAPSYMASNSIKDKISNTNFQGRYALFTWKIRATGSSRKHSSTLFCPGPK